MQLLLSLIAIVALAAFAWALGFRASPVLDTSRALAEAQAVLPGFRATEAALAENGRGALVGGNDGALAVVWPLADGWIARRLSPDKILLARGNRVTVALNEPMQKTVAFVLATPLPAWLQARMP